MAELVNEDHNTEHKKYKVVFPIKKGAEPTEFPDDIIVVPGTFKYYKEILTKDYIRNLCQAAPMHDIGKIGVPDTIINKRDKLTDEEYEAVRQHPEIGSDILKTIEQIPDIMAGARWHHERYDGKGYPDGLKGTEIPEFARIIGVADAYDAMTSKRIYRDILPQQVVRDELEKGKGTQFDPLFAEIMIQMIDDDIRYTMREK